MAAFPLSATGLGGVSTGWACPVCGRGVAPGQATCDHDDMKIEDLGILLWGLFHYYVRRLHL